MVLLNVDFHFEIYSISLLSWNGVTLFAMPGWSLSREAKHVQGQCVCVDARKKIKMFSLLWANNYCWFDWNFCWGKLFLDHFVFNSKLSPESKVALTYWPNLNKLDLCKDIQEARVALDYCFKWLLRFSHAKQPPTCTMTQWCTLSCLPYVNDIIHISFCNDSLNKLISIKCFHYYGWKHCTELLNVFT